MSTGPYTIGHPVVGVNDLVIEGPGISPIRLSGEHATGLAVVFRQALCDAYRAGQGDIVDGSNNDASQMVAEEEPAPPIKDPNYAERCRQSALDRGEPIEYPDDGEQTGGPA